MWWLCALVELDMGVLCGRVEEGGIRAQHGRVGWEVCLCSVWRSCVQLGVHVGHLVAVGTAGLLAC